MTHLEEQQYLQLHDAKLRIAELERQLAEARSVLGEAYQFAGAWEAPVEVLDNLSDAAHGAPLRHATFLPISGNLELADLRTRLETAERAIQKAPHSEDCASRRFDYGKEPEYKYPVCRAIFPPGCGRCERCKFKSTAPQRQMPCNCWKSRALQSDPTPKPLDAATLERNRACGDIAEAIGALKGKS